MALHMQYLILPPVSLVISYAGHIINGTVQQLFKTWQLRLALNTNDDVNVTITKTSIRIERYSLSNRTIAVAVESDTYDHKVQASRSPGPVGEKRREAVG